MEGTRRRWRSVAVIVMIIILMTSMMIMIIIIMILLINNNSNSDFDFFFWIIIFKIFLYDWDFFLFHRCIFNLLGIELYSISRLNVSSLMTQVTDLKKLSHFLKRLYNFFYFLLSYSNHIIWTANLARYLVLA
jgi:hypothetical protein